MPMFPLYAFAETASLEQVGNCARFRKHPAWLTASLESGARALMVFDSKEKAQLVGKPGTILLTIANADDFTKTLEGVSADGGVSHVCWNLRPDGASQHTAAIADTLEFLAKLPK